MISNFYSDLGLKYDGSLNDEKINQIRNAKLSGFKSSEIDIEFSQKKIHKKHKLTKIETE